ncbi:MAG: hypothetical protein ACPGOV_10425 [Magnetovibrionaceae bacterium]
MTRTEAPDTPSEAPVGQPSCLIIGAGGHGKVCLNVFRLQFPEFGLGVVDRVPPSGAFADLPYCGPDERLSLLASVGWQGFVLGLGLAAGQTRRADLFGQACKAGLRPQSIQHPSAIVADGARIGAGCQIMAQAVVQPDSRFGDNVVVNSAAIIEHDVVLGHHAFVSPGACVLGGAKIGEGALIGAGAVVLPGAVVPAGSLVKAGEVHG